MIFVHLLNDRSGSAKVLASIIEGIGDVERDLLVVADGDGVLSSVSTPKCHYPYTRYSNRWLTLFSYVASQVRLVLMLWPMTRSRPKHEPIYINTALPFGGAIFGRLTGRRVIYHLHEISVSPRLLQKFLWYVVRITAEEVRFVSEHQKRATGLLHPNMRVVYNTTSPELVLAAAKPFPVGAGDEFNVLMLATARDYKGIPEFIALARSLEAHSKFVFQLVTNDDAHVVKRYFGDKAELPSNMVLIPRTAELASLYRKASLVVNLSRPSEWIETFGLTLLEAMTFGVPVIGPPEGGPVEVLGEELSDYLISGCDIARLKGTLIELSEDSDLYSRLSTQCRNRARAFDWHSFVDALRI